MANGGEKWAKDCEKNGWKKEKVIGELRGEIGRPAEAKREIDREREREKAGGISGENGAEKDV